MFQITSMNIKFPKSAVSIIQELYNYSYACSFFESQDICTPFANFKIHENKTDLFYFTPSFVTQEEGV